MKVIPVDVDMVLPDDGAVDLFLLQCHSPAPIENGAPGKLPANIRIRRQSFLERFCQWLEDIYCRENRLRPFFVIIPELAVSLSHLHVLQSIAQLGDRPAGVFAGLEFLTRDEYSNLIQKMPDMPEPNLWTTGVTETHQLNTALVLLQQSDGQFTQFIQPKRNPSDQEAATHFNCQRTLFFRSKNQAQGRRLNFCVQICSDFTNFEYVREFRRECEAVVNGRPVDFTFLLQRNENQFAQQFVKSIDAYFAPPHAMVETTRGCLVFANNASNVTGKSKDWGKSMLIFPWNNIRWRTYGSPTYWLHNDKANNFQAVVLREPGECIYWLRYKPHYLVNQVAGSGQPGPFVDDNHAWALKFNDGNFPDKPAFKPIQPVTHWLLSEWSQSQNEFLQKLEQLPDSVVTGCEAAHDLAYSTWEAVLLPSERLSRYILSLYFSCFRSQVLSDGTQEPHDWSADIANKVRDFLSVYTLLHCGFHGLGLMPQPRQFAHAVLNAETNLSLISGHSKPVRSIIAASLSVIGQANGLSDKAKHILILISSLDSPDSTVLSSIIEENLRKITSVADPRTSGDDITSADEACEIIPIYDHKIWTSVQTAKTITEVRSSIQVVLGMEII